MERHAHRHRVARSAAALTALIVVLSGHQSGRAYPIPDPALEYVTNGHFDNGFADWDNYGNVLDMGGFARVTADSASYPWTVQLRQLDHRIDILEAGMIYTLSFKSRIVADPDAPAGPFTHRLWVEFSQHVAGYGADIRTWAVLDVPLENAAGDLSWHTYTATFQVPDDIDQSRQQGPESWFAFELGAERGTVEFDDLSIQLSPPTNYTGQAITIATMEPQDEYWAGDGVDQVTTSGTNHELKLSLPPNSQAFAYKLMYLDIQQLGWDLALRVRTDHPENVGRMYVIARAGPIDFVFHSFHGLKPGTNTITIGSELTTPDPNHQPADDRCFDQSEVAGNGRVCDLYQFWFVHRPFNWSGIYTLGVKLETNGNGAAAQNTDVFVDDVRIVPWGPTPPQPTRRPPIVSHVNAEVVRDGQVKIQWETDQNAGSRVEYGTGATFYLYPSSQENPGETTRVHEVVMPAGLPPSTRYHARIVSRGATSLEGRSGDFTFITQPAVDPVPRDDSKSYPVGIFFVPTPEDQPLAVRAGFNTLFGGLFGSCEYGATLADEAAAETAVARAFLDKTQTFTPPVRAVTTGFCNNVVLNPALSDQQVRDYASARISGVAGHPGLYGYYIFDEPELFDPLGTTGSPCLPRVARSPGTILPQRMDILYQEIHKPPYSYPAMSATTYMNNTTYPYRALIDVPMLDNYPPYNYPKEWIACGLAEAEQSGKPFQHVLEAYSFELDRSFPVGPSPSRYPTEQEMRTMAYLGIVYGARGTWAYSMSELTPFPGTEWVWTGLSNVAKELRRLEPLLASTDPIRYPIEPQFTDADIKARSKAYLGQDYMITINANAAAASQQSVTLGSPARGMSAEVIGEARSVPIDPGGVLKDDWSAYDVHLYRIAADGQDPSVNITSPAQSTTYRKKGKPVTVTVKVNASDNAALDLIRLYVSPPTPPPPPDLVVSPKVKTINQATLSWTTSTIGDYTIKVRAIDVNGRFKDSAEVSITVRN